MLIGSDPFSFNLQVDQQWIFVCNGYDFLIAFHFHLDYKYEYLVAHLIQHRFALNHCQKVFSSLSFYLHLLIYFIESYFILHSWVVVIVLQFVIFTHLVYYLIVVTLICIGCDPKVSREVISLGFRDSSTKDCFV